MNTLDQLRSLFARFPGIGQKNASRMAYFLINSKREFPLKLAELLSVLHDKIVRCSRCHCLTEEDPCTYCSNPLRNSRIICIVEHSQDIAAIEATEKFMGHYHVLNGVLDLPNGVGPSDLTFNLLKKRMTEDSVEEIIIATNPTLEGDVTASYLKEHIIPDYVRTLRIGFGLPFGGSLEYTDRHTIARSFEQRTVMDD